jgi:lipopolysaccharide/colanic/teichoic acid biosynthesis glycosyltransferase
MKHRETDTELEIRNYLKVAIKNYANNMAFFLTSIFSYSLIFLLLFVLIKYQIGITLLSILLFLSFISLIILPFLKYPSVEGELSGKHFFNLIVKRIVDLIFATSLIFTLYPFMLLLSLVIRFDSPGPAIFRQKRLGLNRHMFDVYEFRTMYINDQKDGKLKHMRSDNPQVTRIGRILRRTGLDQLPQFYNILLGDMSVIGPRPLKPEKIELLKQDEYKRFSFPPGLTGLWQISVFNDAKQGFDHMIRLDLTYVDNWSLLNDLKILFKTPFVVMFNK